MNTSSKIVASWSIFDTNKYIVNMRYNYNKSRALKTVEYLTRHQGDLRNQVLCGLLILLFFLDKLRLSGLRTPALKGD